jgi:Ulp1 family protease
LKLEWPEWKDVDINENIFPIIHCRNNPQQNNGNDCGVYVLMYIDFILAHLPNITPFAPIPFPSDFNATAARQRMAAIIKWIVQSPSNIQYVISASATINIIFIILLFIVIIAIRS